MVFMLKVSAARMSTLGDAFADEALGHSLGFFARYQRRWRILARCVDDGKSRSGRLRRHNGRRKSCLFVDCGVETWLISVLLSFLADVVGFARLRRLSWLMMLIVRCALFLSSSIRRK